MIGGQNASPKPPHVGVKEPFIHARREWFFLIFVPLLVFTCLGALLIWQIERSLKTSREVAHSDQVIAQVHLLENKIVDLETGMRGFAITGDSVFLEPYRKALPELEPGFREFAALAAGNPEHLRRMVEAQVEVARWIPFSEKVIRAKKSGGDPSKHVGTRAGKDLTDSIRALMAETAKEEARIRQTRVVSANRAARTTLISSLAALVLFGATLAWGLLASRKQAAAFRTSEEQFRLMVESIQDYALFRLAPDGTILSWNTGAERMKGYKEEEIIGKHFSIFYTPEDLKRDHPAHELEIAKREGRYEEEGWRIRKDGTRFWANVIITPLKDQRYLGYTKVTRDLTRRKLAEEALRSARDQLEIRVKDRTRDLESAIRAREDVVAMVSHDLKNPLSAVQLNAKLILQSNGPEIGGTGVKTKVERIVRASQRMEQLISDILDMAKMEGGTFSVEVHAEHVDSVVRESLELLEPLAAESGIALSTDIGPECCPILIDHGRILQVLSNLIGNAIKFTPNGGRITIGAKESGKTALFWVKDTGPGIPKESHKKIFSRFWQGKEAATRGTGLGLSIAKGIIDAHGGKIWVESVPGNGATFYFTVPMIEGRLTEKGKLV